MYIKLEELNNIICKTSLENNIHVDNNKFTTIQSVLHQIFAIMISCVTILEFPNQHFQLGKKRSGIQVMPISFSTAHFFVQCFSFLL